MSFVDRLKRRKAAPRDYLYVDSRRLNSYLEQISSTRTVEKLRSVRLGFTIKDLSVVAEQATQYRDKTDHEKVCELIDHLDRNGHLARQRPAAIENQDEPFQVPDFVLEECAAARVLVPAAGQPQPGAGVVIWVSERPLDPKADALRPPGLLCIIQDSTLDDGRHSAGFSHSGYTWLQALLYQLNQEPTETVLSQRYPLQRRGDYLYDLMYLQRHLDGEEMSVLRPDPLRWLKEKGCVLSSTRRVVALYRIRNLGSDQVSTENQREDFRVSTFAYGVAIWAAPNKPTQTRVITPLTQRGLRAIRGAMATMNRHCPQAEVHHEGDGARRWRLARRCECGSRE